MSVKLVNTKFVTAKRRTTVLVHSGQSYRGQDEKILWKFRKVNNAVDLLLH